MKSFIWLFALSGLLIASQAQAETITPASPAMSTVAPFVSITAISVNKEGQLIVQGQASEAATKVMINFPDETTALVTASRSVANDGLYNYQAVSKNFEPSGIIFATPNAHERLGQSVSAYWNM